jgi:hypothetical protein
MMPQSSHILYLFCSVLSLLNSCSLCRLLLYCVDLAPVLTYDGLFIDMSMSLCVHDNLMEISVEK